MKAYIGFSMGLVIATLAWVPETQARRDRREGLNFGTALRVVNSHDSDESPMADGSTATLKRETDTQSVSPHLGYVFFDTLNLGVQGLFEREKSSETSRSQDGKREMDRQTSSSLTGASFLSRFLFARVMYFELGVGFYERRAKVDTEYRESNGSGFSGEREGKSERTVGPGYHAGGGIEIPFTEGFHFSTSYIVRTVQLRKTGGGEGSIGSTKTNLQKRELMFGITHYVN